MAIERHAESERAATRHAELPPHASRWTSPVSPAPTHVRGRLASSSPPHDETRIKKANTHDHDLPRPRGAPRDLRRARARRHHHPLRHPGDDPLGRPDGHRPDRPGPHGHRQDPRVRHPGDAAQRHDERPGLRRPAAGQAAGADRRPDPRARAPGLQRPRTSPARTSACACSPSTAASATTPSSTPSRPASTSSSARPAGSSTWPTAAPSTSPTCTPWCSTRPTRCSTSASCPTWSGC